ncbi:hypothetical protein T459_31629 [Capsicum annuum]|uniref:LRAT domain-containing protein n=1 Tax=Capsicum annuum TaxID=4072 RepID=A0A2G2Y402_CAPAN|nr:hypothetical protein T459_31629 [Capsicum annuum]
MLMSSSDFANYLSYVDEQWKNRSVCPFYQSGIYVSSEIVIQFNPAAGQEVETGTALDGVIFSPSTSSRSASQCPKCVDRPRNAGVVSRCLECFLSGGKLYRFHFGNYKLFKNNCEDFAIYCKTGYNLHFGTGGRGASGQVVALSAAAKVPVIPMIHAAWTGYILLNAASVFGAPAVPPIGITFALFQVLFRGMSCCTIRYHSDVGGRKDLKKISVEELVDASV